MEKKHYVCIACPRSCRLTVWEEGGEIKVEGATCKRGEKHAIGECTNPIRTVTSIVRVSNREDTMLSVKSETPIAKGKLFAAMELIRAASVNAPVAIGDVILPDVFGARIVATREVR
jgi:CxxC motif-containing protein